MLDYITGQKSLNENLKLVADSGLYSGTDDDGNDKIVSLEQDHYMSDKNMTRASPKGDALQDHYMSDKNMIHASPKGDTSQDHYMSDKNMIRAFPKEDASQLKDYSQRKQHPSVSSFGNYSLLSTSSSDSDDNEEESTSHPDHYTAAQRTTISQLTSGCSNEVGQCSDQYDTLKQKGVVSEDGGVADNC